MAIESCFIGITKINFFPIPGRGLSDVHSSINIAFLGAAVGADRQGFAPE